LKTPAAGRRLQTGSDFTPKLELNSKKGLKLFYKKLLKAPPAPAFKSRNFPAGKARL
jgi:hypothetical protein